MTEKRFKLGEDGAWTWVIDHTELDNGYDGQLTASECVDLLNALHEENEQLKKDVDCWKQVASKNSDEINVLECENCIHRKGIVCDLDGGHIDFTSWCDYFEYKGGDKND